jgi:hypothetical protein
LKGVTNLGGGREGVGCGVEVVRGGGDFVKNFRSYISSFLQEDAWQYNTMDFLQECSNDALRAIKMY